MKLSEAGIAEFQPEDLVEQAFSHGEEYLGGGFQRIYKPEAKAIYQLL
jgi:hypothetical protein